MADAVQLPTENINRIPELQGFDDCKPRATCTTSLFVEESSQGALRESRPSEPLEGEQHQQFTSQKSLDAGKWTRLRAPNECPLR
jgi:hypothetical protein